jgi:hypothetical protein
MSEEEEHYLRIAYLDVEVDIDGIDHRVSEVSHRVAP